jgi:pimeloyl-ACP methyl ester carboxylesterase
LTGAAAAAPVKWRPCEEDATAECGTVRVPVDWAKPRGPQFDVAVARRKATDPAHRIGSLIINPGGPGGSGVDFALGGADYFSPELRQRFDIVGFDPRGVARSHPVVCSLDLLTKAPSPELHSQAEFNRLVAFNRTLGNDCRTRTGPLFDHVDTLSVVRDIDALRVALGERKINYYGVSYGTLIGQMYAELFPKNFRALVIDSNMDHSLLTRRFLETETDTAEDSFREFASWCARDTTCVLHKQGVGTVWRELQAKADRGQLHDPDDPTRLLTAFDLSNAVFGAFYGPEWEGLAEALAALQAGKPLPAGSALRGTAGRPGVAAAGVARVGFASAGSAPRAAADESVEYPVPVFCEDWRFQIRDYPEAAQLWAQARRRAPNMRMSPIAWGIGTACLGLTTKVNNPQHPLKVKGAAPILILNGLHDPATGYNWGANAARQLGRAATLVTYEGWGHGVYGRGACTVQATDRYLVDLTVPKRGSRCPAVPPTAPTARRSGSTPLMPQGPLPGLPGWLG